MQNIEQSPKGFPFDCKGCEHFKARDMSVDDYVLRCDVLDEEVDECDAWN